MKKLLLLLLIPLIAFSDITVIDNLTRPWNTGTGIEMNAITPPGNGYTFYNTDDNTVYQWVDIEWIVLSGGGGKVGEDWITATEYLVGDYVSYNDDLWKATKDHTSIHFVDDLLAENWKGISQTDIATGLTSGGTLGNIVGSNFTVDAGNGVIVDWYSNPTRIRTPIAWSATILDTSALATSTQFWIYVDSSGVPKIQATEVTAIQIKTTVFIGTGIINAAGEIAALAERAWTSGRTDTKLMDITRALGYVNVSGNIFSVPGSATGTIQKTAGELHAFGANPEALIQPNLAVCDAKTTVDLIRVTALQVEPISNQIPADVYDLNGAGLIPIPIDEFVGHRLYMGATCAVILQYGQSSHETADAVKQSFNTETFIVNDVIKRRIHVGWVIVEAGDTLLANAQVINCGRFGCGSSSSVNAAGGGGDFFGPAEAVQDHVVTFADATGKVGRDSGVAILSITRQGYVGEVFSFAGTNCPERSLLANGALVSRVTYPNLFAVIGTIWGAGDGSTTFSLPNLTNRFLRGSGTSLVGIAESDTTAANGLSMNSAGSHSHTSSGTHRHGSGGYNNFGAGNGTYTASSRDLGQYQGSPNQTSQVATTSDGLHNHAATGTHAHSFSSSNTETRPDNYRVNYCIVVE